jgi:AraC family transcriptional regulator
MQPKIVSRTEIKLIGIRTTMSFATIHQTASLWQRFMPRRKEIQNNLNADFYSVEKYSPNYFDQFNPSAEFEKWAAIEVSDFNQIPNGMQSIVVPSGLYAVFIHKGPPGDAPRTYQYIFNTWLPTSGYIVDDRPHMAVMGAGYRNNDPDSVEDIWIPVKFQ